MKHFLLIACGVLLAASCTTVPMREPLRLEDASAQFTGIDDDGTNLEFRMHVVNPVTYRLERPSVDWRLEIDGRQVTSGARTFSSSLEARRENVLVLPARITHRDLALADRAGGNPRRKSAVYRFAARMTVKNGPEILTIDAECTGAVPVYRAPSFRLVSVESSTLLPGPVRLSALVEAVNNAGMQISVEKIVYHIATGDTRVGPFTCVGSPFIDAGRASRILLVSSVRPGDESLARLAGRGVAALRLVADGPVETEFGTVACRQ